MHSPFVDFINLLGVVHTCQGTCVEAKGQPMGVWSLLPCKSHGHQITRLRSKCLDPLDNLTHLSYLFLCFDLLVTVQSNIVKNKLN